MISLAFDEDFTPNTYHYYFRILFSTHESGIVVKSTFYTRMYKLLVSQILQAANKMPYFHH